MQSLLKQQIQYLGEEGTTCRVFFSKDVLDEFEKVQKNALASDENGGIILGLIDGDALYVKTVTLAGDKDKRTRYTFLRQDEKHLNVWTSINNETKGRVGYLGEWHSHPEKNPNPSKIDREEWEKIKRKLGKPLLFIIIGAETMYLEGLF